LRIAIVSDEETSDDGTRCLVEAGLRPKVALLPDSTAPGWDIEKLAKGFWRVDLIAQGRTAHGGRPWEGESAGKPLLLAHIFNPKGIAPQSPGLRGTSYPGESDR